MPKQIAQLTPQLRSYARALTSSQVKGDALVQVTVEAILANHIARDPAAAPHVAFHRALHQVWRRSAAIAPVERQRAAILLVGLEGLSEDDAAWVLELPPEDFRSTLAEAQRSIAGQAPSRVLIIEDEPIIALDLTRLVRELGHEVVGVAATQAEAIALARLHGPELVLADIHLADGSSGIDAANDILAEFAAPVIFVTAFPEHLLTGERPEPAFLITKPFREDAVRALVSQTLLGFTSPPSGRADQTPDALHG